MHTGVYIDCAGVTYEIAAIHSFIHSFITTEGNNTAQYNRWTQEETGIKTSGVAKVVQVVQCSAVPPGIQGPPTAWAVRYDTIRYDRRD